MAKKGLESLILLCHSLCVVGGTIKMGQKTPHHSVKLSRNEVQNATWHPKIIAFHRYFASRISRTEARDGVHLFFVSESASCHTAGVIWNGKQEKRLKDGQKSSSHLPF